MSLAVADDREGLEPFAGRTDHQLVDTVGSEDAAAEDVPDDDPESPISGSFPTGVWIVGGVREVEADLFRGRRWCDRGQGLARPVVDNRFQPHRLAQPFSPPDDLERLALLHVDRVPVDIRRAFEGTTDPHGRFQKLGGGSGVVLFGGLGDDRLV